MPPKRKFSRSPSPEKNKKAKIETYEQELSGSEVNESPIADKVSHNVTSHNNIIDDEDFIAVLPFQEDLREPGDTDLHLAIRLNQIEQAKQLINEESLLVKNNNDKTALDLIIDSKNLPLALHLIDHKSLQQKLTAYDWQAACQGNNAYFSPLHWAIEIGDENLFKQIKEKWTITMNHDWLVGCAVLSNCLPIVQTLIEEKYVDYYCDLCQAFMKDGSNPLTQAILLGHDEIFDWLFSYTTKLLLSNDRKNIDPHRMFESFLFTNFNGNNKAKTKLIASWCRLIESDISFNPNMSEVYEGVYDDRPRTLLGFLADCDETYVPLIKVLIAKGAALNNVIDGNDLNVAGQEYHFFTEVMCRKNKKLLDYCLKDNQLLALLNEFLMTTITFFNDVNPNSIPQKPADILFDAIQAGSLNFLNYLLNVVIKNLQSSVDCSDISTQKKLEVLKNTSRVNSEGISPLYYAIKYNHCDIFEYLYKSDPKMIDIKPIGFTSALHFAISNKSWDTVKLLINKYRQNVNGTNNDKSSMLLLAIRYLSPFYIAELVANTQKREAHDNKSVIPVLTEFLKKDGNMAGYQKNN